MKLDKAIQWMIHSTWFKKYSGMVGGFCLGMVVHCKYGAQIAATLTIWNVTEDEWNAALWAIVGASGIATSIGFSLAKDKQLKKNGSTGNGK